MKIKCATCKTFKDEDEFYKDNLMTNGRKSSCKDCSKKRSAVTRKKRKDNLLVFFTSIIG